MLLFSYWFRYTFCFENDRVNAKEKIKAQEKKQRLVTEARGACEVCGKPLLAPQLAHRIPKSKQNIKKWGVEIIHHDFNLVVVCSLKCNGAVLLNPATRPIEAEKLIKKIQEALCK